MYPGSYFKFKSEAKRLADNLKTEKIENKSWRALKRGSKMGREQRLFIAL